MSDVANASGREIEMGEGDILVSSTDVTGRITFTNQNFVRISGYSEKELVGAPHNIIRHPDMPKEAFADLWTRLKAGQTWRGLVKNRTKTGDFYWVEANVAPVIEDGAVTGFISVRTKPHRDEVALAEKLYAQVRTGTLSGYELQSGQLVKTDFVSNAKRKFQSVNGLLNFIFATMLIIFVVLGFTTFFLQETAKNFSENLYENGTVQLSRVSLVSNMMQENQNLLYASSLDLAQGKDPANRVELLKKNIDKINKQMDLLENSLANDDERQQVAQFKQARQTYGDEGVLPALKAIEAKDVGALNQIIADKVEKLSKKALKEQK